MSLFSDDVGNVTYLECGLLPLITPFHVVLPNYSNVPVISYNIATCFQDDGYIPKHSVLQLQKAWPGSEVRWVTGGHVSSFLLHNGEFRKAIVDGLNRLQWKENPL